MCGICGIALKKGLVEESKLRSMTNILRHRGPDDEGVFVSGNIGLGHSRLSIIDVKKGHQPMANEDGTIWVVYNGEIYNHDEIRRELISRGHEYKTRSDTETILHLYEDKELEGVNQIRGMFAYSLWDSSKRRLILVRDRLGVKPLYYYFDNGTLIWGSEIKAILESGYVKPRLRLESLPDYLANRYTCGEETLFEGVKRLLPGHLMVWENGKIEIRCYWDLLFREPDVSYRETDLIEEFRALFQESIRLRLMSDVPLGMFLSGGIDSSAIAAMMSGMVDQPIKTFSVAFGEREANELHYARIISKMYKTEHHEVIVKPGDFFKELPRLIWQEDEPIAFPSSVPLYFVSDLARQYVKVVLTGEGSDELLAGYAKYKKTLLNIRLSSVYREVLPPAIRDKIKEMINGMGLSSFVRTKLVRSFFYLDPDIETIYFDNFSAFPRDAIKRLLTPKIIETLDGINPYKTGLFYFTHNNASNLLDQMLYTDIKTFLHELLMKQDQMSMAASIESRVPFLDHKLVEFVAKMPATLKLRGWTTKYILVKSMRDILPKEILYRKKMGFPVPIRSWFRKGFYTYLEEYLLRGPFLSRGYFNKDYVSTLLRQHVAGVQDHSDRLWSLLNFEIWNRIFIDGEGIGK